MASLLPQNFMFVILSKKGEISIIITSKSQNSGYKTPVMVNTLKKQPVLKEFLVFARVDINQRQDKQIVQYYGKERNGEKSDSLQCVFFSPHPPPPPSSHLSFFRPSTSPKGCYFYSPQSSSVIKSKMAATTNEHKQPFTLPKYSRPALQTKKATSRQRSCDDHYH